MNPITNADKAKEAKREVAMRRRVYPNWISSGRLTQAAADRQIATMEAIAADYAKAAEDDAAKGRLL